MNLQAVSAVFEHEPLTDEIILMLNPDAELEITYADAAEIGYARAPGNIFERTKRDQI